MLEGELDVATASTLERALARMRSSSDLCLDLRPLDFIDCRGLRVILNARKRRLRQGGSLAVIAGDGQVARLIGVSGVGELMAGDVSVDARPRIGAGMAGAPLPVHGFGATSAECAPSGASRAYPIPEN